MVAVRRAGVAYRVLEYEHDPATSSYGLEAAEKLGVEPGRVLKTLIASVDGRLVMALLGVEKSLNLKALASATGGKRADMAEKRAAERATGYVVGGISPLGQRRSLAAVVDREALRWERVLVSAGRRGLELEIAPADLVRILNARSAALARV